MAQEIQSSATSATRPTTETSQVFDPHNPQSPVFTVNMTNVTKLTATNYIAWSQQIRFLLEGHNLQTFINETDEPPPSVVTVDGLTKPNPVFANRRRQDRLIHSALLGALASSSQPLVSCATSSLERTYGRPTRGHLKQLKNQLKNSHKRSQSIDDYMRGIRAKADQFALLEKPLDHEDLIDYVLDGLGDKYKSIVDAANGRETHMTFVELHEKLLNQEVDLLHLQYDSVSFPVIANTISTRPRLNWQKPTTSTPQQGHRDNYKSSRGYLGKCQLCGI